MRIHVAAGAIRDSQGRILITKRPEQAHQGGLWEFPGGKLEPGESARVALKRELHEELGIRVLSSRPLIRVHHDYGDRHVLLDVHEVDAFSGNPTAREGQPMAWVHPRNMDPEDFPAADRPVICALRLPRLYLITGEAPRDPTRFLLHLRQALEDGIRLVQLRAHGLSTTAYAELAASVYRLCASHGAHLILNRDPSQACHLSCHGLHLTAQHLAQLTSRPGAKDQLVGASCHGAEDLSRAASLGLDYALLSPVQATASHPGAIPMGWEGFASLADEANLPVYALGGLTAYDLHEACERGAQGIAAIRGLWR